MKWLEAISGAIVRLVDRYLPDPFTFAILMTVVTLILALTITPAGPEQVLVAWGDGLAALHSSLKWR